jgi:uroporphyrinogen III methyltransferase/synthase
MGKVYLIGAGPGDAGLITVKGLEKLTQCDAVVYDRLATEELLDCVKADCEKIYVGKEAGKHYKKQEEINEILLDCAKRHDLVVRLKGGDSFVFGRGGEEIEVLEGHNIPYEVIPGVTSAVAVPECAGIPVTHRGVSRSFHVITGHTNNSVESPDYDYDTLAKLEGTVVFLMGLSNLSQIAQRLIQAGKKKDTPAAVISNGTLYNQKLVRGTLENIAARVKENELPSPAVIVIGDTAQCQYRYPSERYQRVGITATDLLWEKLKTGFDSIGMKPVSVCNMKVVPTEHMKELRKALQHLEEYQWLVFTSQNGVKLFFEVMRQEDIDLRRLGGVKFAVLGSGTAGKLAEYGMKADFIPSRYTVSALASELVEVVKTGEQLLIPRAVQGSRELNEVLDMHNVEYRDIPIYDVVGTLTRNAAFLDTLDYLVFVSASGVTAFFEEMRESGRSLPKHIKIACIGEITRKRLVQEYGEADVIATVNDVTGVVEAVATCAL